MLLFSGHRHLSPALQPDSLELTFGRTANTHMAFACKYLSKNTYTVVEEWTHSYFCLGYFSPSKHFDLVIRLAEKVWRHCVLFSGHDLGFRDGNCIGLLANTGLFLSTGNRYLFLLQRRLIHFDFSPLLLFRFPVSGVKVSQSEFLIYTPLIVFNFL